jgi:hypothetical protein
MKIRNLFPLLSPVPESSIKIAKKRINVPQNVVFTSVNISSNRERANQVLYIPKKIKSKNQ